MARKLSIRKRTGTRRQPATPGSFNVFVKNTFDQRNTEREAGFISPRKPRKDGTGGYRVQVWSSVFGRGGNYRADTEKEARQIFRDLFKGGRI